MVAHLSFQYWEGGERSQRASWLVKVAPIGKLWVQRGDLTSVNKMDTS